MAKEPEAINVDEHVILTWRAFSEIIHGSKRGDEILSEIEPFKAHIGATDIARAIAELPDKETRQRVCFDLCDDMLDEMSDSLEVHQFDDDFIWMLYQHSQAHEKAGIISALEAVPEIIGLYLSIRDQNSGGISEDSNAIHRFVNKVRIIDA